VTGERDDDVGIPQAKMGSDAPAPDAHGWAERRKLSCGEVVQEDAPLVRILLAGIGT
jgi:hypothetical protein